MKTLSILLENRKLEQHREIECAVLHIEHDGNCYTLYPREDGLEIQGKNGASLSVVPNARNSITLTKQNESEK